MNGPRLYTPSELMEVVKVMHDKEAEKEHAERLAKVLETIPVLFEDPLVTVLTGNCATDFWNDLDANILELHRFPCAFMLPNEKGDWVDDLVRRFYAGRKEKTGKDIVILTYDLEIIEQLVKNIDPPHLQVVRVSEHGGKFDVHVFNSDNLFALQPYTSRLMWDPR